MNGAIGEQFAKALAAKDGPAMLDLLDPKVDFKGLTPRKFWETTSAEELVDDIILGAWFDPTEHIETLEDVESGTVADRERVAWRLRVRTPDGLFLVEQQAYFGVEDDRINFLRVLCSGYRPMP
jgi:hypothetical protein